MYKFERVKKFLKEKGRVPLRNNEFEELGIKGGNELYRTLKSYVYWKRKSTNYKYMNDIFSRYETELKEYYNCIYNDCLTNDLKEKIYEIYSEYIFKKYINDGFERLFERFLPYY